MRRYGPLILGILVTQAALYGPSLVGSRILLPTDVLLERGIYAPDRKAPPPGPRATLLSDLVVQLEPMRAFAAAEVRAGRMPLWNPYLYCGSPLLAAGQAGVLSPFQAVRYLFPGPRSVAWIHLLLALFAGLGAHAFFRRGLRVGPFASWFGGVVYPLTGFMLYWDGFPLAEAVAWLPWVCVAAGAAVRRPRGFGPTGLALSVAGTLLAGHPGTSAAVLLVAAAYGLFTVFARRPRRTLRSLAALAGGAVLGVALSAPAVLPELEYLTGYSQRAAARAAGTVENPPIGLRALPLAIAPDTYGTLAPRTAWTIEEVNKLESPACAYAGLLTALALAPLAVLSRRHRGAAIFFLAVAFFGLAQPLGVPGIEAFLRLPPFSLLQNNRFSFATAFAVLSLGVLGLAALRRREIRPGHRLFFALPGALLLLAAALSAGSVASGRASGGFAAIRLTTAGLAVLALGWWVLVLKGRARRPRVAMAMGFLALIEVAFTAFGVTPQSPPDTYYPPNPFLSAIARETPGRVLPAGALLPNLGMVFLLRDIRGYDALDPTPLVELLDLCRHEKSPAVKCAALFDYFPRNLHEPARMSSIIHMLGVTHALFPAPPPPPFAAARRGDGYWVLENPRAMPRVFVPGRVVSVPAKGERLARLAAADFRAEDVAFLEVPVPAGIPASGAAGAGRIAAETPCRVEIELDLQTPGLTVFSDLWYPGWTARLGGREVEIFRVNHALRGVAAPAGRSTLVMTYEPTSFAWGLRLAGAAAAALLATSFRRGRRRERTLR